MILILNIFCFSCVTCTGGGSLASSKRCNPYMFETRRQLFQQAHNLLIVPGDNDWNECSDYRIDENTSPSRGEWRDKFTTAPFDAFTKAFPDGTFPTIVRKTGQYADADTGDENPEIYYFEYDSLAFFGLNRVLRQNYISDNASKDYNEEWAREMLAEDENCSLQSVGKNEERLLSFSLFLVYILSNCARLHFSYCTVIFTQIYPKDGI